MVCCASVLCFDGKTIVVTNGTFISVQKSLTKLQILMYETPVYRFVHGSIIHLTTGLALNTLVLK